MRQYRLAIICQKYRCDGGTERFVSHFLKAIDDQDFELNVITRQWPKKQHDKWHMHICNPVIWSRVSRDKGFARATRSLWKKEQFDIIQSHERIVGCNIYRAGSGVHHRCLMQRARVLPYWRTKTMMHDRYHRYIMRTEYDMYQASELKTIICNSKMIKKEIIEDFSVNPEKIQVIYNPVNSEHFIPVTNTQRLILRQQLNLPINSIVFCFIGSNFSRKGLSMAIKAISSTPSYLIVIGQDKSERRYQKLAQSLSRHGQIRFLGMQKETLPFYQISDALLLPTLYDPFPNVILEAMACGLPVITSNSCGGAEFIEQGRNGFFCDALNINQIREAIMEIPLWKKENKMSIAARNTVTKLTIEKFTSKLISLYKDILQ